MKKLLLALLLLCAISSHGQKIHFTDTSNVWSVCIEPFNDFLPPNYEYYSFNWIGDTVVDTHQYRIFNFRTFDYDSWGISLVREDTGLKKVYIRDLEHDSDIILLDYNLSTGDTFIAYYATTLCFYKYYVLDVDSTLINGIWHKIWHMSNIIPNCGGSTKTESYIIEGIGSIRHPSYLLHTPTVEPSGEFLYCFSNQAITPLVSPAIQYFDNSGSCSYFPHLDASLIKYTHNEIQISPNPALDLLMVSSSGNVDHIAITNTTGQIIYTNTPANTHVQVDISSLTPGVYFLKVNKTIARKFVKQ